MERQEIFEKLNEIFTDVLEFGRVQLDRRDKCQ